MSGAYAAEPEERFGGLLRARDLTPFGYLRLDMRPAPAIPETRTGWAVEAELGDQNTWALSDRTEKYLSGLRLSSRWHVVLESAVKISIDGRRTLLSTGRVDVGTQATLQRFGRRGAVYLGLAAVYYDGRRDVVPTDTQIVPTFVGGYEHLVSRHTSLILQGYISPSVYTRDETDLSELRGLKYLASLGIRHLRGNSLFAFAVTENLQNINNTPDIGLQLGWAYVPGRHRD
jgi:hypothetical protein